jgi:hypothetical protein
MPIARVAHIELGSLWFQLRKGAQSVNHSTIDQHQRDKKTLIPPFLKLPQLRLSSWVNDRLPEMLWATLLISHLPRSDALDVFREVAKYVNGVSDGDRPHDITHTGLSKLRTDILEGLLAILTASTERKEALRPLLLLREVPIGESWTEAIGVASQDGDWGKLMLAVASTFDHQSQEATDCRWARILCMMAAGKLEFPADSREEVRMLVEYPNYGDMRTVRPTIRSTEQAIAGMDQGATDWPTRFWAQCLSNTPCFLPATHDGSSIETSAIVDRLNRLSELLVEHDHHTRTTSGVDPRHDTVFGMTLYCLSLILELTRNDSSRSIEGRIALRTIVECLITLKYLAKKDDAQLWKSYRVFGAGQAKLAYLKLDELANTSKYVDEKMLKQIANEDLWQEFLPIELGHWEKADLRKMSIDVDLKDLYDSFYPWTSTFSHGHWGAIRDAIFDTCLNPLHRFHRIPRAVARRLPDVLPDACALADRMLAIVSNCYPDFPDRIEEENH